MNARTRVCAMLMLSGLAAAGCTTVDRHDARLDARTVLGTPMLQPLTAEGAGQSEMGFGDRFTATNLFERAESAQRDPQTRFNLAVGYEQTGRLRDAQQIYQQLMQDGRYTRLQTVSTFHNRDKRERWFTVAEEAARRNAYLQAYFATIEKTGGDATAAIGVTDVPPTHLPDQRAFELDGQDSGAPFPR